MKKNPHANIAIETINGNKETMIRIGLKPVVGLVVF